MKRIVISLLVIVGALALINAIGSFRSYNVILVTIDTLRADYLSCYNSRAIPTKNIDEIARRSILFKNTLTTIPITLPAHTAMLTSRVPHEALVFNNGEVFEHKMPLLPDLLEKKGYNTGAFISLGVLKQAFGLSRGFNTYEDNFDKTNGRYYKSAAEVNELALPWIEQQKNRKFFAWIHYSDPHEPYITVDAQPDTEVLIEGKPYGRFVVAKKENNLLSFSAEPGETKIEFRALIAENVPRRHWAEDSKRFISDIFVTPSEGIELVYGKEFIDIRLSTGNDAKYFEQNATLTVVNNHKEAVPLQIRFSGGVRQRIEVVRGYYAAEVQYVDHYVGELWKKLDDLGLRNNTIVILTADHGEGLRTHGNLGHVDRLYNETVHVPMMIYYPLLGRQGTVVDEITTHLDIMPTVVDLLHIRNEGRMDGRSLKLFVSWSPIDWLFAKREQRSRAFVATYAPEARVNSFAMFDHQYKLIHSPLRSTWKWEAYDMTQDPIERKNIARIDPKRFDSPEIVVRRGMLEEFRKEAEAAHGKRTNPELSPEQEKMLRDLGYLTGGDEKENGYPEEEK